MVNKYSESRAQWEKIGLIIFFTKPRRILYWLIRSEKCNKV